MEKCASCFGYAGEKHRQVDAADGAPCFGVAGEKDRRLDDGLPRHVKFDRSAVKTSSNQGKPVPEWKMR